MKLKTRKLLLGYMVIALFSFVAVHAQTSQTTIISIEEYIDTYKEIAIKEMMRTGVPASITLAQGIVETENGNSKLVKKSNNHFGIKCKETWTGPSVSHDDDAPSECFRKYNNAEESYVDHSNFLVTRKHYLFLFSLNPEDYKAWAYGLKKAGYATNPKYPEMLIKYIETYKLNDYSLVALGKKKAEETNIVKNETPLIIIPTATETKPLVEKKQKPVEPSVVEVVVEKKPQVNYPIGEFKINETRVIYITKGTPYLSIAQKFTIPVKWLYDFNDVKETEAVEQDQLIYLQRKRRTGANEFHIVAEGETMYNIAQSEGIRLEALQQLNLLTANQQPVIGEKLNLQTSVTTAPKFNVQKNNTVASNVVTEQQLTVVEKVIHIVQPKEILYSISKKYEVSLAELQQWNQLTSLELKEGSELIINKK